MHDDRQRVSTGSPWEQRYGYSRALRVGNQIFLTGTAPVTDDGSTFAPGDAHAQAERCFAIIEKALEGLGADRSAIVRSRMYVTDISRADEFGLAHREFFGDQLPCLSMVEVNRLIASDMLVEIECDAITT
jgi:enamine deaminase RidA (YjgF/YER057c/UK114 family)